MMACEQCNCEVNPFEGVHLALEDGSVFLYSKCHNQRAAEYADLDFTHVSFEPITCTDVEGQDHIFHITTHLFGNRVSMEAVEEVADDDVEAYRFCLIGDAEGGV